MADFTGPPWSIVTLSGLGGPYSIKMGYYKTDKTFYGVQSIHRKEDAQLIASAPELYESLKELFDIVEMLSLEGVLRRNDEAINKAKAALKAAEGEG